MVSATSWKLEPPVAWRVSRQKDKLFQHVFKSSEPWGPSAVILLIYRPNHWLLRFSVKLTGRCQGGHLIVRIVRSVQAENSSMGENAKFPLQTSILFPTTHTQGRRNQALKGSYSFGKTSELEKQWRNLHYLSISQLKKVDSRLHWAWESREINT